MLRLPSPVATPISCATRRLYLALSFCKPRNRYGFGLSRKSIVTKMDEKNLLSKEQTRASFRLCNVSSFTTELLELRAENPLFHVVFIPGNPGIVMFYKDFVEALYKLLGGRASVTAIGHISHTKKDWERGRLFSLQDQIDHKINFITQELGNTGIPVLLVGHSIGSYISLEVFRRLPEQVKYCIGLYPFLSLNKKSSKQIVIGKIAESQILCNVLSYVVAVLGLSPNWASRFLVEKSLGMSWSATAIETACSYLLQYHVMRNILYMTTYEFKKLAETPDWMFIRGKQDKIAFLFGVDDHWGPLTMFEEISKEVSGVALSIEKESHTHAFCCSEAGSEWVADHVVNLIDHKDGSSVRVSADQS